MGELFDLKKQLAFYGAYHSNPLNQLVHIVFVPTILASAIMFACRQTDLAGGALTQYSPLLVVNAGLIIALVYGIYYTILDRTAGFAAALGVLAMWPLGNYIQQTYSDHIVEIFIISQIGSWVPQILSHRFIEGRAPAFFDNLAQAFLLAPFFVFLEVLFKFGYRPELNKEITELANKNIAEYRKTQNKKKE